MLWIFRQKETFAANDLSCKSQSIWISAFWHSVTLFFGTYLNHKKIYDLLEKIWRNFIVTPCWNFIIISVVTNHNEIWKKYYETKNCWPKNFAKFTEKYHCHSVFFNKKNTPVLVFSCEFLKKFRNTFSTEHLRGTMFLSIELLNVL